MNEAVKVLLAVLFFSFLLFFPKNFNILGVDAPKKLSEKKRDELYIQIKEAAVAYGIGCIDNETIDRINILEATKLAMKDALRELEENLRTTLGDGWKKLTGDEHRKKPCCIQHILIDALTLPDVPIPQTAIVHGDGVSISIAAASILAKVTRDHIMLENHKVYPGYAFDCNKGYGTKAHYEGIKARGICPIHRKTFLSLGK